MTTIKEEAMNTGNEESFPIEQREGIKLKKNAKGDYQWEIKILNLDTEQLQKLDSDLRKKFGSLREQSSS